MKKVLTGAQVAQEVLDEFYFSSPAKYGGSCAAGDEVEVISEQSGKRLALGIIIEEGKPYEECRTVRITKRFEQVG